MRLRWLCGFAFVVTHFVSIPNAHALEAFIPPKFKGIILQAPIPHHIPPPAVHARNVGAQGVYRLTINPQTGGVEEVGVLNRAGHKTLDSIMVLSFANWKFKPGSIRQLDVPVTFSRFDIHVELRNAVKR